MVSKTFKNKIEERQFLIDVCRQFNTSGKELWLVGGAVRDFLLDIETNDYDFATDATTEEILEILSEGNYRSTEIGIDFGTIESRIEKNSFHITSYRKDEYIKDSRKPRTTVATSLLEDLSRRDFTINAIAYDPLSGNMEDPFKGIKDLGSGELNTPMDPAVTFSEDPLRMLRACRFISKYQFSINQDMFKSIQEESSRIEIVSVERIRDELSKMILGVKPSLGLRVFVESGLSNYIIPEINDLKMESDPDHQHKDVYEHTMVVTDTVSQTLPLRLAALLHDIAKPRTKGIDGNKVHFRHHEVVGGKMTQEIMERLRYEKALIKKTKRLVELHLRPHTFKMGWTDSAVRRYIVDAGDEMNELNELVRADVTTKNENKKKQIYGYLDQLESRIAEVAENEEVRKMRPPITGNDVMKALGLTPGPMVGKIMKELYEQRINEGLVSAEEALELAKKIKEENS